VKFEMLNTHRAQLKELGSRIQATRLSRNISLNELSEKAGIGIITLHRMEHGQPSQTINLLKVLSALDMSANLNNLVPELSASPLAQAKLKPTMRKKAAAPRSTKPKASKWTWGE
jgi:transcriptional regulator with XRE-family HTH domain